MSIRIQRALQVSAALLIFTATPAWASDASTATPWLWAAPALYGFESNTCEAAAQPDRMIDPIYCPLLGPDARIAIGREFGAAVASHFAQVEPVFGQHLPSDATPSARLRSTLAVSLRLSRASKAVVQRGRVADAYMPLSLTLDITNPATGEVVFTRSRTDIPRGEYNPGEVDAQLVRQFPAKLRENMLALVREAATQFKPYEQRATVLGSVELDDGRPGYVLDKGRNAGLRQGDGIGSDGSIIRAGLDYAIVTSALGSYQKGQVLARTAAAPVATLAKPSVLIAVEEAPVGYDPDWLAQILESELGAGAALAPIPVNPAFSSLRRIALDGAGADLAPDERALPDYVASLRIVLMDPTERPGEIPGTLVERHQARVFITLVDSSGRAIAGWQDKAEIRDEIKAGVRVALRNRRDEVMRNALINIATKMATFRPQPATLPIAENKGTFQVNDPAGLLTQGLTLPVLRPAHRFDGIAGDVMVPVGMVTTGAQAQSGILARDAGVKPLRLRARDVVELANAGEPVQMHLAIGECTMPTGKVLDSRGQVAMPIMGSAATSLITGHMAAGIRVSSLSSTLGRFARSFAGWDRYAPAMPSRLDACFRPVISVSPAVKGYQVIAGFTLHSGQSGTNPKIGSSGLSVNLTPAGLPSGTSPAAAAAWLQLDLAEQAIPLAAKAASTLRPKP